MRLYFRLPVIAKPCKRLWQSVFLLKGRRILSRYALRMTNRLVATNAVGVCSKMLPCHCEHRQVRGNPFSFKGSTDSFTLRAQNDKPFSCHECRKVYAVSCRSFPLKKSRLPFFGSLDCLCLNFIRQRYLSLFPFCRLKSHW